MQKKHMITGLLFLLCFFLSPFCLNSFSQAETIGKGARIIVYGEPDQGRFHLGGPVGTSVELTAEPTGSKTLSDIQFTSSDTSVCSMEKAGDHWRFTRLKEGISVIRMSCKADDDTVVRTLLISSFTPIETEDGEDIMGTLRTGAVVYFGCSDVEGITSKDTEIKDVMTEEAEVTVLYQCGDYYRVELEDGTFGDTDETWGHVKKSQVHIPVTGLETEETLSIYEGDMVSLNAKITPHIATNTGIQYKSSNTNVAVVSETGKITGIHKGSAVITAVSAENEKIYSKCRVTVKVYIPVTGIEVSPHTLEIDDGTTGKITASILPADASVTDYSWRVTGEDVLKIDTKGRYQALKPGKAIVTAITKEGGFSDSCEVTVRKVDARGVFLQGTMSLDVGEVRIPVWRMMPANATNKNVKWHTDNPDIVKVDKAGRVTGVKTGETDIHIETEEGGYRASCKVTVEAYVKNIHLKNTSFSMALGSSKRLQAEITPEKATKRKIIWKSENPSVVSVTQKGKIKALALGTAKILVYDEYTGAYDFAMIHVVADLKKPALKGKKSGKSYVLSWKTVKNATGYILYQYRKKKKGFVKIQEFEKAKKRYVIKNAKSGARYKLRACYQSQGKTEKSNYSQVIKVK